MVLRCAHGDSLRTDNTPRVSVTGRKKDLGADRFLEELLY